MPREIGACTTGRGRLDCNGVAEMALRRLMDDMRPVFISELVWDSNAHQFTNTAV